MTLNDTRRIEINNQIVSLRRVVRKTRVRVIWKLTREIKQLRQRKHGDEKIINKCQRKADKLIKEMYRIKQFKDDTVSKFAIFIASNSSLHEAVIKNQDLDSKTKAICRLALHKDLKSKISEFIKKYPDYEPDSKFLSQKKINSIISPSGKTKKLKKDDKEIKTIANSSSKWVVEDIDIEDNKDQYDDESSTNKCNSTNLDVPDKKLETKADKNENKITKNNKLSTLSNSTSNKEKSTVKTISKLAEVKKLEINSDNVDDNQLHNVETVKNFTVNNSDNNNDKEHKDSEKISVTNEDLPREVDTFFTTCNGNESYMSIVVKPKIPQEFDNERRTYNKKNNNNNHNNNNDNNNDRRKFGNNKTNQNFIKPRVNSMKNPPFKEKKTFFEEKSKIEKKLWNKNTIDAMTQKEVLHPSWSAKRKQQDIMKLGFQGKKIVFNHDD